MCMFPGSHLITTRNGKKHHGIYLGDGDVVCHSEINNGLGFGPTAVLSLEEFSGRRRVWKRKYKKPSYLGDDAVSRALSKRGKNIRDEKNTNLEPLCSWVVMGNAKRNRGYQWPTFLDEEVPRPVIKKLIETKRSYFVKIPLGSHLVTPRSGYTHHGIYVGEGEVVHYSGLADGLEAGPIEKTTLEAFSSGNEIKLRKYKKPAFKGNHAVERAYSRIGEDRYDLHSNNCEHFCSWVITDRSRSKQVEFVEDFIEVMLPGISVASIMRIRRHSKQVFDGEGLAKDIAEMGLKPILIPYWPAFAAYKSVKWLLSE